MIDAIAAGVKTRNSRKLYMKGEKCRGRAVKKT